MSLQGKAAIITGSTSGIGHGIAQALAKEGVNVVINGFGDAADIEKLRAAIEQDFGVKALYHDADVTKTAEINDMVDKAVAAFGKVDILVNNAGIQFVSPIDQFPEEKWDAIIATNLSSVFHCIKAVLPGMKAAKWGRIINIASAHGLVASPNKGAYVAAKHGVVGLTKSVALETAREGITANSICPGYVMTPLVKGQIAGQAKANNIPENEVIEKIILEPQPTKEFIEIEDVAALAVYLCGDAARGITGSALPIDGGWTAK